MGQNHSSYKSLESDGDESAQEDRSAHISFESEGDESTTDGQKSIDNSSNHEEGTVSDVTEDLTDSFHVENFCDFSEVVVEEGVKKKVDSFAECTKHLFSQCSSNFPSNDIPESIIEQMREVYEERLKFYKACVENDVDAHICGARYIFQLFTNVLHEVHHSKRLWDENTQSIRVAQIAFRSVENFLFRQVSNLYNNINEISPDQALKIIVWYDEFLVQVEHRVPYLSPLAAWQLHQTILFNHYAENGFRQKIKRFIEPMRLVATGNEEGKNDCIQLESCGNTVCDWSEDIAFQIAAEMDATRCHLPIRYFFDVYNLCAEEMSEIVSSNMVEIRTNWKAISENHYCSVITAACGMSRMLGDVHDQFLLACLTDLQVSHHDLATKYGTKYCGLKKTVETIQNELDELAECAARHMCQKFYCSPGPKHILSHIGGQSWGSNTEESKIKELLTTLAFRLKEWEELLSSSHFFHKVLQECFDLTLQTYVEFFYKNTMAGGICKDSRMAQQLRQDYQDLACFFNSPLFERHQNTSDMLSVQEINLRLLVVLCLSRVLDPIYCPPELQDDLRTIFQSTSAFGQINTRAVQHLIGLRGNLGHEEPAQWSKIIDEVKIIDSSTTGNFIHLPDLRNSPYI